MGIITLWHPVYRIDGLLKAITALASIPTAFLLVRLVPAAVQLPSPDDLRREIDRRTIAENELRETNAELERRVEERTNKLKRYNNALQRVAYISGHDLKEPLRSVTTFTQLLEQTGKDRFDGEQAELMAYIVEGSERMQRMVDDLLEYTHIINTVNESSVVLVPVSLTDVLIRALENIRARVKESAAKVSFDPLPVVKGEPLQLQQVFQNLLTNAIKYGLNAPEIHVSARREGSWCVITVRDNGIGFEMQYADQIFEAFTRLDTSIPGSGIGLAICKNIVEALGGTIWAESAGPGQGTTFHFRLRAAHENQTSS
jgi:signal transduction histidine kinase